MNLEEMVESKRRADEAYWRDFEPFMTDAEYDDLVEMIKAAGGNPESKVIDHVSNGKKYDFGDDPMLSLNKVYSTDELIKWAKSVARDDNEIFWLEPKYDGISAFYNGHGVLATRGDGHFGEIITSKIPLLRFEKNDSKRGEIIFRKSQFDRFHDEFRTRNGEVYKNPRNAVAGVMNSSMSDEDNDVLIQKFHETGIFIDFIGHDELKIEFKLSEITPEEIDQIWSTFEALPYEQDGLVIKLADAEYTKSLGNTSHHPRGAMALKRNEAGIWSKVVGIDWTLSGTDHSLTPTLEIEPIDIGGVTVSHVLAHNAKFMFDNSICIGDEVCVIRSGGVIPKIVGSRMIVTNLLERVKRLGFKTDETGVHRFCPECGSQLVFGEVDCYCFNDDCPGYMLKRLYNAVSKGFEIKGLAESTIKKIYDKFGITKMYQLFDLDVHRLARLEGFGEKSAEQLYDVIQAASVCTPVQVIVSLGIPLIGKDAAEAVLAEMPFATLLTASEDRLRQVAGFGPERASSLCKGLQKCSKEIEELLMRVELKSDEKESKGKGPICFTGEAPYPRSQCWQMAITNGWTISKSITKEVSLLVCADSDTNSTKAQKAKKYGIEIMAFSDWFNNLKVEAKEMESSSQRFPIVDLLD